jgi:hypothetical protein
MKTTIIISCKHIWVYVKTVSVITVIQFNSIHCIGTTAVWHKGRWNILVLKFLLDRDRCSQFEDKLRQQYKNIPYWFKDCGRQNWETSIASSCSM